MTEFQRVPDAESLVEPDPLPAMPDSLDVQTAEEARSMWADAWYEMRRNPMFWISAVLILLFATMAAFPSLFTSKDPLFCDLNLARQAPSPSAWFGYDLQGCDVYARTVYGARAVSYTHLDVYKRQACCGAVPSRAPVPCRLP